MKTKSVIAAGYNRGHVQRLEFLSRKLCFHEELSILVEKTRFAFPPLHMAANRYELVFEQRNSEQLII